jgi:hypothetical protein
VAGAQLHGGGQDGVVDVVRVRPAIVIAVDAELRPPGGQELGDADGRVELGVAVPATAVGVGVRGPVVARPGSVQAGADDGRVGVAVLSG